MILFLVQDGCICRLFQVFKTSVVISFICICEGSAFIKADLLIVVHQNFIQNYCISDANLV